MREGQAIIDGRIIGEVHSHQGYDGLHALFRARADEVRLSRETIDALSGLQSGYASKLLAPVPIKGVGQQSLGPLMGALGVKLVMVEDTEMLERMERQIGKQISRRAVKIQASGETRLAVKKTKRGRYLKGNTEWGRMMRARQLLGQSPAKRKRIARIARRSNRSNSP